MRSDFSLNNPYSIVRVQSNNHRCCIKVLFSCGVPWVTLHTKNRIWSVYASQPCSFMFPAGVAISTQTLLSNVWSRRERVLLSNRVKSDGPYRREGGHDDSEPERPQQGAVGDEGSPRTTIT